MQDKGECFVFPSGKRKWVVTDGRPCWIFPLIKPTSSFRQGEDGPFDVKEHKELRFLRQEFRLGFARRFVYVLREDQSDQQVLDAIIDGPPSREHESMIDPRCSYCAEPLDYVCPRGHGVTQNPIEGAQQELDELQAENARLREALDTIESMATIETEEIAKLARAVLREKGEK